MAHISHANSIVCGRPNVVYGHRHRRDRGQQHDGRRHRRAASSRATSAAAGQSEHEEEERRRAQPRQAGRPAQHEVLEPEVQRAAAALRGDDVEDVAEGVLDQTKSVSSSSTFSGATPRSRAASSTTDDVAAHRRRGQQHRPARSLSSPSELLEVSCPGRGPRAAPAARAAQARTVRLLVDHVASRGSTLSALTSQMSWCAPASRLSTARIAVSIEWSELL